MDPQADRWMEGGWLLGREGAHRCANCQSVIENEWPSDIVVSYLVSRGGAQYFR